MPGDKPIQGLGGYNSQVNTFNGTYSVGQTRNQALQDDSYKSIWGIDYKDLDQDNNGVLS